METKICSKCGIDKELSEFGKDKSKKSGYKSQCKKCVYEREKVYKIKNSNLISLKRRKYYLNNIDKEKFNGVLYREKNKDILRIKRQNKYKDNVVHRLRVNIRRRINNFLKNKNSSSFDILGCDIIEFKFYIESLFTNEMSWDNYGKFGWHIDHIIPLSSAQTEEEIYKLCHYTNLQPLWWYDNLKKSNKTL